MSETCPHDELSVGSQVDLVDQASGKPWLCIKISVRCDACHTLFSWGGLASGLPNRDGPVVSADGYELRAPIAPRPGAAVGVMVRAGLEDRLRNPYTDQNVVEGEFRDA